MVELSIAIIGPADERYQINGENIRETTLYI